MRLYNEGHTSQLAIYKHGEALQIFVCMTYIFPNLLKPWTHAGVVKTSKFKYYLLIWSKHIFLFYFNKKVMLHCFIYKHYIY